MTKKSAKKAEPLVYIGPNLQGGRLSRFTVFRDGEIPPYLIDLAPKLQPLIVPVTSLLEALKRTEKVGTPEYQAYQDLKKGRGV